MEKMAASMLAALGLSLLAHTVEAPTTALALTETPEREVAEICEEAEALGALDDMGRTRIDCVGALMGPRDAAAMSDIRALCTNEQIQEKVRAADEARCVQRVQEIVVIGA